ncbi:MAG: thiamine diphosphokinase [Elusimicrobia bacterium]|nr:thiamine diphosphokinase [Elusimicrobiota bacterium]
MRRSPDAALLLLNGDIPVPALVRRVARRCSFIVCADGGARHAARLGLRPAVVVGDMDSLPKPLPRSWRGTSFVCDFDEDSSDFEKALDFLAETGCERLYVAGLLGGRLDHALVNLAVAESYGSQASLVVVDRGLATLMGPGRRRFALKKGGLVSLLAAGKGARVSVAGVRYPLKRALLKPGGRGLSNVAAGAVSLAVHSGRVWVMTPGGFSF